MKTKEQISKPEGALIIARLAFGMFMAGWLVLGLGVPLVRALAVKSPMLALMVAMVIATVLLTALCKIATRLTGGKVDE